MPRNAALKLADIVRVFDGSWSYRLNYNGSLEHYYGIELKDRNFIVAAFGEFPTYNLPTIMAPQKNDVCLVDFDGGDIIYINSEFCYLEQRKEAK